VTSIRQPSGPVASLTNRPGSKTSASASNTRMLRSSVRGTGNDGGEWEPPQAFDEYKLIRVLGRGSMGSVYLAHDTVLDRSVAVKFVGNVAPDAEDRERFLVEARAVARIQHPNVMVIYRVGELEGHPYLITEYIRGKPLTELTVPLPWRKALELAIGLARGLATAHRMGVLHRDIKLANAVLSEDGEIKLLDFSLAKLLEPTVTESAPSAMDSAAASLAAISAVERHMAESKPTGRIDRMAETVKVAALAEAEMSRVDGEIHSSWLRRSSPLTQAGTLLGTPHYMAPELWRAESATRRSDVYALGVVLYILLTGKPPTEANSPVELATRVQEQEPRPLIERAPRVDPRLAAIIDKCLRRDPYERFASADELRSALELLTPMGRELAIPEGNPYRGLQAFEAQHRALFFGRAAEIRTVVERLRSDPLVVVAGDSGAGKSSLCRAGVLPLLEEGVIEPSRSWASAVMTPGRYPLQTLQATLSTLFDMTEETVAAMIQGEPDALVRGLRKQLGEVRGRLLFIDQLEELTTLGEARETEKVGHILARLASGIPGLRVLTTVRGDFLTRVAQIPGLGDEIGRSIYLLRPLSPEGAREAIVGPAQTKGVSFENEALVEDLIQAGSRGSLPLLQFALAELWEIRDKAAAVIGASDLTKIGGVTGALARHADGALAQLLPAQRRAGRRVLMRLVTIEETRASLTEDELVAGEAAAKTALGALIHARLVVVREVGDRVVYEIAHEALLAGWSTLRGWLDEERESRAVRHRLELAVIDWERLGQHSDGLWTTAQIKEARILDLETLRPRERDFLEASQAAMARGKALRRAALASLPVIAALVYFGVWFKARQDREATIGGYMQAADQALAAGRTAEQESQALGEQAFSRFDHGDEDDGEKIWAAALALVPPAEQHYTSAAQALETALSYDPTREALRVRLADVLYARALLAERLQRKMQVEEMLTRLALYDPEGTRRALWDAPASLRVVSEPPGARLTLEAYEVDEDRRRVARPRPGFASGDSVELRPGSYRLTLVEPGLATVVYPLVVVRGEELDLKIPLPPADAVPPGYVYVPAGRFLFGAGGDEEMRKSYFTNQPLHSVTTPAYLVSATETTYGEYITFLEGLPAGERAARLPASESLNKGNSLRQRDDGRWELALQVGGQRLVAATDELIRYSERERRAQHDWTKFPVGGIDVADAAAYLRWLDRTGRLPGARFCTEHEWERATRGADGRTYPHGENLSPSDANFDDTYGRKVGSMGPDQVGSYPQSESPFGLFDGTGNIFEITVSPFDAGTYVARGGAFYFDRVTSRLINRYKVDANFSDSSFGLRVCATYKDSR